MLTWLRNKALMTVTLGHFSVDMYSGMLPLILVALTAPLGLSYAQIGIVSTTFTLTSSLTQPFFGWLADRWGGRGLAAGGIMLIAVATGLMRSANSYTMLLVLAPLAGLGSAAFHPQGAANAALASGRQKATGVSIFMLGGNSGFAFGPVVARVAFAAVGQLAIIVLTSLGFILGFLQIFLAPAVKRIPTADAKAAAVTLNDHRPMAAGAAFALIMVIFMRQWVHSSLSTYLPQWLTSQGYSVEWTSNLMFAMLLPLAFGGLFGGFMSDRVGRKPIIVGSLACIGPLLLLLLNSSGAAMFVIAIVLGLILGASFPITLVMAQELLPRGIGIMSGLALGFTFIAGGIGVAVSGWLADHIGLTPMLVGLAGIAFVGTLFALLLPSQPRQTVDAPIPQPGDAARVEMG